MLYLGYLLRNLNVTKPINLSLFLVNFVTYIAWSRYDMFMTIKEELHHARIDLLNAELGKIGSRYRCTGEKGVAMHLRLMKPAKKKKKHHHFWQKKPDKEEKPEIDIKTVTVGVRTQVIPTTS